MPEHASAGLRDTAQTLAELNDKVREAMTLGRPADVAEYAGGLRDVAAAYEYLCNAERDE